MKSGDIFRTQENNGMEDSRKNRIRNNDASRTAFVEECIRFINTNGRLPRLSASKSTREWELAKTMDFGLRRGIFTNQEKLAFGIVRQKAKL